MIELTPEKQMILRSVFVAFLAATLIVWCWIGNRFLLKKPLLPYVYRRPAPWTILDLGAIVLVYLLLGIFVQIGYLAFFTSWGERHDGKERKTFNARRIAA